MANAFRNSSLSPASKRLPASSHLATIPVHLDVTTNSYEYSAPSLFHSTRTGGDPWASNLPLLASYRWSSVLPMISTYAVFSDSGISGSNRCGVWRHRRVSHNGHYLVAENVLPTPGSWRSSCAAVRSLSNHYGIIGSVSIRPVFCNLAESDSLPFGSLSSCRIGHLERQDLTLKGERRDSENAIFGLSSRWRHNLEWANFRGCKHIPLACLTESQHNGSSSATPPERDESSQGGSRHQGHYGIAYTAGKIRPPPRMCGTVAIWLGFLLVWAFLLAATVMAVLNLLNVPVTD